MQLMQIVSVREGVAVGAMQQGLVSVELPRFELMNPFHRPSGTGRSYWGPGDVYTFLVTGAESGGAYFAMEALVPPGGGPPPPIHHNEDETFYIVEGQCSIRLGAETVLAGAGDFVNVPRGTVHCFHNEGTETMRMILTFTPAGIETFFEETLQPVLDAGQAPLEDIDAIVARYLEAAPRHGLEFVADATQ
jgi:mannose-6-phosphate isomerase-like protein (cupin superfamily)